MENTLIRSLLPSVGVMIDVGACHGKSHAPFSGWTVYAFEPDPDNRRHIPKRNGVHIDGRALSDTVIDSAPYYRTHESAGMSSLLPFLDTHTEAFSVAVTTLDVATRELGIEQVDYLKVDAEGYDLQVLCGFPWHRLRPQVVMCEFGNSKTELLGYTHDDLAAYLIGHGYQVVLSEWVEAVKVSGRYQHKWLGYRRYPCEGHALYWGNMIACRDDYLFGQLLKGCGL